MNNTEKAMKAWYVLFVHALLQLDDVMIVDLELVDEIMDGKWQLLQKEHGDTHKFSVGKRDDNVHNSD